MLLESLVDYAGLFPPASLELPDAATRFARYQRSPFGWMLGSFVIPLERVVELLEVIEAAELSEGTVWPLSVLVRGDLCEARGRLESLATELHLLSSQTTAGEVRIQALEVRPAEPDEIRLFHERQRGGVLVFYETPVDSDLDARLAAIAEVGGLAKVRTGGVVAEMIPPATEVARFVAACQRYGVPWKATAGLHHPVRAEQALTYENDPPRARMHGFLNLLAAAARAEAASGGEAGDLEEILLDVDNTNFTTEGDAFHWRDTAFDTEHLRRMRRMSFVSFGSCSFEEPVDDLQSMGWVIRDAAEALHGFLEESLK